MPRVVHFDLPAENPEELQKFYQTVFGWSFEKWDDPSGQMDYWMINTGKDEPGIDGGMSIKHGSEDQMANTINVSDIDDYLEKVELNGGKTLMSRMEIPNVGYLASFIDPQGNKFMLMEDLGE